MGCVAVNRTKQEAPELLQGLLVVHLCLYFNGCFQQSSQSVLKR